MTPDRFNPSERPAAVLHGGTVTVIRTPSRILGITAEHVIAQYEADRDKLGQLVLQLGNASFEARVIDRNVAKDLATLEIDESVIVEANLRPLESWPPQQPVESRGLLVAGFSRSTMVHDGHMNLEWKPFWALMRARTVSDHQITMLIPPRNAEQDQLPLNADLGGISGGPILGIYETDSYVWFYRLAGIIVEHPNYKETEFSIERVVGSRADVITEFGTIR